MMEESGVAEACITVPEDAVLSTCQNERQRRSRTRGNLKQRYPVNESKILSAFTDVDYHSDSDVPKSTCDSAASQSKHRLSDPNVGSKFITGGSITSCRTSVFNVPEKQVVCPVVVTELAEQKQEALVNPVFSLKNPREEKMLLRAPLASPESSGDDLSPTASAQAFGSVAETSEAGIPASEPEIIKSIDHHIQHSAQVTEGVDMSVLSNASFEPAEEKKEFTQSMNEPIIAMDFEQSRTFPVYTCDVSFSAPQKPLPPIVYHKVISRGVEMSQLPPLAEQDEPLEAWRHQKGVEEFNVGATREVTLSPDETVTPMAPYEYDKVTRRGGFRETMIDSEVVSAPDLTLHPSQNIAINQITSPVTRTRQNYQDLFLPQVQHPNGFHDIVEDVLLSNSDDVLLHDGPYSQAFAIQNAHFETAIESLDFVNNQILLFLANPEKRAALEAVQTAEDQSRKRDTFTASLLLMRKLLLDAQLKFRKMVDSNKCLAARVDGSMRAANEQLNGLKAELADTNKRIMELNIKHQEPTMDSSIEDNLSILNGSSGKREEPEGELHRQGEDERISNNSTQKVEEVAYDRERAEHIAMLEAELTRCRETMSSMRVDRKKLRIEKLDLLNQMKQLYGMLEDKDHELRDFIRNYEQRMEETNTALKRLATEKQESEKEKWALLRRAHEASEQVVLLRAQLDMKEEQLKRTQSELKQVQGYLMKLANRGEASRVSLGSHSCHEDPHSTGTLRTSSMERLRPVEQSQSSTSANQNIETDTVSPPTPYDPGNTNMCMLAADGTLKRQKKFGGSLTRLFGRRQRKSFDPSLGKEAEKLLYGRNRVSEITSELTTEKLRLVDEAKTLPMDQWKQATLLAWLEITLHMPMYVQKAAENVKSGKVLANMNDNELETVLCITNYMHRKKLRQAVDDCKHPVLCKFPKIYLMDYIWVADIWMRSIGLSQHCETFRAQLVDGRVLNTLRRKELEKYLGVNKKFHQTSIYYAIELLRGMKFDKHLLIDRRQRSEKCGSDDVLVWTNHRFIQWLKNIDLDEYAGYLTNSGVHGALVVMETTFTADAMAAILNIPASKNTVRKHLSTEFDVIVRPARAAYDAECYHQRHRAGAVPTASTSSFNRSFTSTQEDKGKKRTSIRGSLGKAFGRKHKHEKQNVSTSNLSTISSPAAISTPKISAEEYKQKSQSMILDRPASYLFEGTTV